MIIIFLSEVPAVITLSSSWGSALRLTSFWESEAMVAEQVSSSLPRWAVSIRSVAGTPFRIVVIMADSRSDECLPVADVRTFQCPVC